MRAPRRVAVLLAVSIVALVAVPAGASRPASSTAGSSNAKPEKPPSTGAPSTALPQAHGVLVAFAPSRLRSGRASVRARVGVRAVSRVAGTPSFLVRVAAGEDPVAIADRLNRSPSVRLAEPNWISLPSETLTNDPLLQDQWGLRNTGQPHSVADPPPGSHAGLASADGHVTQAWDTTQGSSDTVVAIIDSGIDLTHPDLVNNLWSNPGETPANGIDDDLNGFVDDVNGWDFYTNDSTPEDDNGHGTHVAGIVAATANNAIGGAGICPGCRIMPLRAGSPSGSLTADDILAAIAYARANGADIINMSFGVHAWSSFERNAIAKAGEHGILVVAAAGNDAADNDYLQWHQYYVTPPNYPSSYNLPNLISVAASTDGDDYGRLTGCYEARRSSKCLFTNWGRTSVDLAAPGVDITSTWPTDGYGVLDGTSMASPFVAGVAGLVKSLHPGYSPVQIKNAILNSVDRPNRLRDRSMVTDGRVNAEAALTAPTSTATPKSDGTMEGAILIHAKKSGALSLPADINDIFRMRLIRGRHYAASLTVPKGHDFDLFIWKPGTTDTWPLDGGCSTVSCDLLAAGAQRKGVDEYVRFTPHRSGMYYFHVTTALGHGTYTLRVGHA